MISLKRNALVGPVALVLSSVCIFATAVAVHAQDGAGRGIRLKPDATLRVREPRLVVPTLDYTAVNLGVNNLRARLEQAQKEAQAWDAENTTLSRHLEVRQKYLEDLQKFLREPVGAPDAALPTPAVTEATASTTASPGATASRQAVASATGNSSWLDWLERKHLWIEAALAAAVIGLLAWALMLLARRQRPQEQLAALGPALIAEQDAGDRGVHGMAAFTAVGDVPDEGAGSAEKSVVAAFSAYDRATESLVKLLKSGSGKHQLRLMRVLSAAAKKDEFLAKAESLAASSGDDDSRRWVELMQAGSPLPKKDEAADEAKVEDEIAAAAPPADYPLPAAAPAVFTAEAPELSAAQPASPSQALDEPGMEMPDGSLDYTMYQLRQKARSSRQRIEPAPDADDPIPSFESVVPESGALTEPFPDLVPDAPDVSEQTPADRDEPAHAGIRAFPLDDFGDDILGGENDTIEDTNTQKLDAYLGLSLTDQDDAIETPAGSELELTPRNDIARDDIARDDEAGHDAENDTGDAPGNGSPGGAEIQSRPVHRKRKRKKKK